MRPALPIDRGTDASGREGSLVSRVAARFDISEHEVFRLAYRRWHGREAVPESLEVTFSAYLWRDITPLWARHFAREALAVAADDLAIRRRLGLVRPEEQGVAPRHGRLIVAATAAVFLVLYAGLLDTTYDPSTSAPVPLSCRGGGPGLAVLERFAYAFADRRRPDCPEAGSSLRRP